MPKRVDRNRQPAIARHYDGLAVGHARVRHPGRHGALGGRVDKQDIVTSRVVGRPLQDNVVKVRKFAARYLLDGVLKLKPTPWQVDLPEVLLDEGEWWEALVALADETHALRMQPEVHWTDEVQLSLDRLGRRQGRGRLGIARLGAGRALDDVVQGKVEVPSVLALFVDRRDQNEFDPLGRCLPRRGLRLLVDGRRRNCGGGFGGQAGDNVGVDRNRAGDIHPSRLCEVRRLNGRRGVDLDTTVAGLDTTVADVASHDVHEPLGRAVAVDLRHLLLDAGLGIVAFAGRTSCDLPVAAGATGDLHHVAPKRLRLQCRIVDVLPRVAIHAP